LSTTTVATREEVRAVRELVPTVKITEIDYIVDRMLLIGPPGIGKTERIVQLARREAEEVARRWGKQFYTYEELREKLEKGEEVDWNNVFVFVDVRNLLRDAGGGNEAAQQVLDMILKRPSNFYVYLRIIAPHVRPEDIQIPRPSKETKIGVEFELPTALSFFTLPGINGVIFVDEITNLPSPIHASFYYSLILEKELGLGNKLSDNVKVVAAGNPTAWSQAAGLAGRMPEPLVNRMVVFYIEPPTVEEWLKYMEETGRLNPYVATFLVARPGRLLASLGEVQQVREMSAREGRPYNFPTPRSWTMLSEMLNKMEDLIEKARGTGNEAEQARRMLQAVIYGAIGPVSGREFYTFLIVPPIDAKEFLQNPRKHLEDLNTEARQGGGKEVEAVAKLLRTLIDVGHYMIDVAVSELKKHGDSKKATETLKPLLTKLIDEVMIPLLRREYPNLPPQVTSGWFAGVRLGVMRNKEYGQALAFILSEIILLVTYRLLTVLPPEMKQHVHVWLEALLGVKLVRK